MNGRGFSGLFGCTDLERMERADVNAALLGSYGPAEEENPREGKPPCSV